MSKKTLKNKKIVKLKQKIRLPSPHIKQKKVLASSARFRIVACGRRWGKTVVGQIEIIEQAAVNHKACWWLAPTYSMADHVWRELKFACHDLEVNIDAHARRLDFKGGGWIAIKSTHTPDNLRGAGLDFVVLDEAAFMEPSIWPQIVRPMLLERKGHALFLSSPNGKNWFWERFIYARNGTSWRHFHYTAFDNPLIDPAELDAIRLQTPERIWLEEYMAQFNDDSGQVFRGLREAATAPLNTVPTPGQRCCFGVDWGRENDYTAIVIMDADTHQILAYDRFNQVNWSLQRGRLRALYDHWQPAAIYAESNSIGSPNIEALQQEGLPVHPFVTTAASKPALIESLALAIERRDLALLPDNILLDELANYRMERLPAGGYRYSAPSGLHDDLVIATALAWHACRFSAPSISFA
ncbi:MAG: terminase family protein [Chloroflexota bacterium]